MYFKVSWDQDFDTLMMHLWAKYGREVFTQNGIGDQLDLNKFSKDFFNNNSVTADVSIDANANVSGKTVIDYNAEFPKPLQKYNSHYLFWKQFKTLYGLSAANEMIEKQISGEIYINDLSKGYLPYCFNYSTYDVALSGLTMAANINVVAPKSLCSFIRQMEQFIVYAANSTAGATGLADFLIVASYYVDRILMTGYDGHIQVDEPSLVVSDKVGIYISEMLRSFIYTVNWKFRGAESPFTNISIYDEYFLINLVPDYVFPDGNGVSIVTVQALQKLFIKAMNDELKRSDLAFPITTACFYVKDGEIKDTEFLEYVSEQNLEHGFINIYNGDHSTISACCRLKSSTKNEYFNSFGAGSSKIGCYDDKTEVLTSNGWKLFKDVDINSDKIYTMDEYKNPSFDKASEYHEYDYEGDLISFKNKSTDLLVTPNHRMVLDSKKTDKIFIKRADEIENNLQVSIPMSLPYNSLVVEELHFTIPSLKIKNKFYPEVKINYNDWVKFMGIYLSEGCCDKDGNKNNHGNERYKITISQSKKANPVIYNEIYKLLEKLPYKFYAFDKGFEINNKPLCLYLRQFGDHSDKFVPEDIKYLPKQYLDSFWEWLVKGDGHIISTGTEMYWTTSKQLNDDIQMIMALMGYRSRSEIVEKKDAVIKGRLISKENVKDCYRSIKYIRTNNAVKKHQISRKSYSGKVYCLSVPNGTLFVRRNGKVAWSGNSAGVVTVNLPRLAYLAKNKEDFIEKVGQSAVLAAKINNAKRNIIKKCIDLNSMPLYSLGYMELSKQYSTYGVTGLNEALSILGYDILSEDGEQFVLDLLDVINEENDKMAKRFKSPHNCEQVPAESSAVKLAQRDRTLKYQDEYVLYSNQFIPLTTQADMLDRLRLQGKFDGKFSGGAVCHVNIGEKIKDKQILTDLMKYAAKCGVVYWAINYALKRCKNSHVFVDEDICPFCGEDVDHVTTRTVGFFTNVAHWNKVRREYEFPKRQFYKGLK